MPGKPAIPTAARHALTPGRTMIVNSFGRYLAPTVHDHENIPFYTLRLTAAEKRSSRAYRFLCVRSAATNRVLCGLGYAGREASALRRGRFGGSGRALGRASAEQRAGEPVPGIK
jgi:hypothetical protein